MQIELVGAYERYYLIVWHGHHVYAVALINSNNTLLYLVPVIQSYHLGST